MAVTEDDLKVDLLLGAISIVTFLRAAAKYYLNELIGGKLF